MTHQFQHTREFFETEIYGDLIGYMTPDGVDHLFDEFMKDLLVEVAKNGIDRIDDIIVDHSPTPAWLKNGFDDKSLSREVNLLRNALRRDRVVGKREKREKREKKTERKMKKDAKLLIILDILNELGICKREIFEIGKQGTSTSITFNVEVPDVDTLLTGAEPEEDAKFEHLRITLWSENEDEVDHISEKIWGTEEIKISAKDSEVGDLTLYSDLSKNWKDIITLLRSL